MKLSDLLRTDAPTATLLIRVMVGTVFVSEGLQKFIYPDALGPARFESMGFAAPWFWATLVGSTEIIAGLMVIAGILTRLAAIPLAIIMLVAIATTKVPILLGHDIGPFRVRTLDTYGFWSMAHEARTDWSMLLGSLFLAAVGAGPWSLDAKLGGRAGESEHDATDTRRAQLGGAL